LKSSQFVPATDRLLLKRLPPPAEGAIIKPQIAVEQSEYGFVWAAGTGVDVPLGVVAKFSRFSAEEIHFDDEEEGDEFILAYKHDIRGWFTAEKKPSWLRVLWVWLTEQWPAPVPPPCELEPIVEHVHKPFRGSVEVPVPVKVAVAVPVAVKDPNKYDA
jgi:hypothetical protein